MDVLHELVLPRLDGIRKQPSGYMARCPAHDDGKASLSVDRGKEQPVVFKCHAGCDRDDILAAIGLTWADVCKPRDEREERGEWTPRGQAVAVYDYVDEGEKLLYQVLRTADKQFPTRRPDPMRKSGWDWRLGDTRRVVYRLPKVLEGIRDGHVIFIVEGEKDVHTLEAQGLIATCNPGGVGQGWRAEYCETFRDADVTIVCDNDDAGHIHARKVRDMLTGFARSIRIMEPAAGKDVTDHFRAGKKLPDLIPIWTSEPVAKLELAPDLWEFISVEDPPYDWVVPNLLERGDRLVWTGMEGLGKSTTLRQLATTIAAGMHPFTWADIPKMRVLLIDCENSERQSRRKFRPLAAASIKYSHRVPDGALRLIHKPAGIDLGSADDTAWLHERVTAHQPDILFIGPFYRLHAGNTNDEPVARHVVGILDAVRTTVDCALVLEAHSPHGEGMQRSVRPIGSSLLLRWPEFGYGIAPAYQPEPGEDCETVNVLPWRGARDKRDWPTRLTRTNDATGWPWKVAPHFTPAPGWEPTTGRDK